MPRTRGDGPIAVRNLNAASVPAPHLRTWSQNPVALRLTASCHLPCTCRDGPHFDHVHVTCFTIASHTRGWPPAEQEHRGLLFQEEAPANLPLLGGQIKSMCRVGGRAGLEAERPALACRVRGAEGRLRPPEQFQPCLLSWRSCRGGRCLALSRGHRSRPRLSKPGRQRRGYRSSRSPFSASNGAGDPFEGGASEASRWVRRPLNASTMPNWEGVTSRSEATPRYWSPTRNQWANANETPTPTPSIVTPVGGP